MDIKFPVDNGEEGPDPNMREFVMGRVREAMDEAGVWEVIAEEVGWLCEGVCERIADDEDEVAAAMAAVKVE